MTDPDASKVAICCREQAAEFLAHWAGLGTSLALFDGYPAAVQAAYRAAMRRDLAGPIVARLDVARERLGDGQ